MVLFFGPPGSGKSVQGQLLVDRNQWLWLSTGDLFRQSEDVEVLKRLATGELIDDELTNKVLGAALEQVDANTNVVLDGYPRNLDQVKWLDAHAADYGRDIDCVILFDVPREVIIDRLSGRGRAEDSPEIISRRLDIYQEKTSPVMDFYRQNGTPVQVVDGTGDVEVVHERIQEAVESCLKTK